MNKILTLIITLIISSSSFAQLPNGNMHLIANIDDYAIPPQFGAPWNYAAIWGYVAPDNREYAILGAALGPVFYDVTDSSNITEIAAFIMIDSMHAPDQGNLWREMKVYSHYAYVVSEADTSGVKIFDLQYLPDSVRYVGKFLAPGHSSTHSISQSGPYLYLNGANAGFGHGTVVLDLSVDPENPTVRGKWNNHYVHDARIIDDTIYAACINDGYLSVIDATNKDSLRLVHEWLNLPNPSTHNSALTVDKNYIMTTDEVGALPRLLKVWDIQDIQNPVQVATWQPTGITTARIHNIEIYGDTAVIAHYTAGVYVLDISDPENPVQIAWYDTHPQNNNSDYAGCWGVYKFPSGKIVASDMNRGLFVLGFGNSVGITNNSSLVDGFELKQNYPNPFNPSTEINFSIPKSADVSLKIYDANGKEIAQLINGYMQSGSHSVTFETAKLKLASGVYFYTLTAGELSQTKKMLLVK